MPSVAVTGRTDLTDSQWAVLEALLPTPGQVRMALRGRNTQLIDGIRWRTRIAHSGAKSPTRYGPLAEAWTDCSVADNRPPGCGHRFDRVARVGRRRGPDRVRRRRRLDHRAGPPARYRCLPIAAARITRRDRREPDVVALGGSPGGWTTKLHLGGGQNRRPAGGVAHPGSGRRQSAVHRGVRAALRYRALVVARCVPGRCGLADEGVQFPRQSRPTARGGIRATITIPSDQLAHRRTRGK